MIHVEDSTLKLVRAMLGVGGRQINPVPEQVTSESTITKTI